MTRPNCTPVALDGTCPVFLWEKGKKVELDIPVVSDLLMVEIHVTPEGLTNEHPTFVFVMETDISTPDGRPIHVVTQISFKTLWPAIEAAIQSKGSLC